MPGPPPPPILWPGLPAHNAYFSNPANRHPPWGSGPPSYHPPILPNPHTQAHGQGPYSPRRIAPRAAGNQPQGGISTYDMSRLSTWVSDNSYPNHPKASGHAKLPAPPKHHSSHHSKDSKDVIPRKGKEGRRPEAARPGASGAKRLVCDFCQKGTPKWLDDGRRLCDGCHYFRKSRLAGK